jgi:hypothetical protein
MTCFLLGLNFSDESILNKICVDKIKVYGPIEKRFYQNKREWYLWVSLFFAGFYYLPSPILISVFTPVLKQ